jgi:Flp pilus assembly protein TadG
MRERGGLSTEFLILLPVMLLLLFGALELGRAASLRMALGDGAWRAARYLSIHSPYDDAGARDIVLNTVQANALGGAQNITVTVTDDGGRSFGHTICVRAESPYCPSIPFLTPECLLLRAEHCLMVERWP